MSKVKDKKKNKKKDKEEIPEINQPENQNPDETNSEKEETPLDKFEALEKENSELKNNHIRLMAEFDNFRKRTRREKEDLLRYGSEGILVALLPILDDFGRTIQAMENADKLETVQKGIEMVSQKISHTLEKQGLKPIDSIGNEFDPKFHEAVTTIPAPDETKQGKVIDEAEKGYLLHDRVIRFSKVIVGE